MVHTPVSETFDLRGKKVWVTGHNGMVGAALVRRLASESCTVVTVDRRVVDLTRQADVQSWVRKERPQVVIVAAAKVGGILANSSRPADFLYDNLMIEANLIEAAHSNDVEKLLFLGSSCIYPRLAPQPIEEASLLTGPLEPTNEWYAIAKIAGIKLVQAYRLQHGRDFISAMPTNLYGPEDNFDLQTSHVLPALIRKAHDAKVAASRSLVIWGTGSPRREFLHVDDCADALVLLLKSYSDMEHINVGSGSEITILELARIVCRVVGFEGEIEHDLSKPDGTPAKLMSAARLTQLGWRPRISLEDGIAAAYRWFMLNVATTAD